MSTPERPCRQKTPHEAHDYCSGPRSIYPVARCPGIPSSSAACTCTIACIPQGITEEQTCRLQLENERSTCGAWIMHEGPCALPKDHDGPHDDAPHVSSAALRTDAPVLREPDVEKALTHLSAAAVEADLGIAASGWKAGETPNPAWWAYREAAESISRAERALIDGRRRGAIR